MAIKTAENGKEQQQTELQVESRDEKLSRLLHLQTEKLDLENQLESAKSISKSYSEQVKNVEEQLKKLTREINAGQETLTVVDSEETEEPEADDGEVEA